MPETLPAQQTGNQQSQLTLKQVKQRLSTNKKYLKQAEKQGKAGNSAGLETALNNYDRGMAGLNTALSQGHFNGTPSQQEEAYNRVQKATQKHIKVLNKLLSKVPAQAAPHIQHAIDVSKTGQTTALSQLSTLRTQQAMQQGNRPNMGEGQGMGRPGGAGNQSGMGHMGGAGPMGGGMRGGMGGGMGRASGPPMGGGHGR